MCAFDFRTSPTGDVFFESDIWQVKKEVIVQLSVPKTSDGFSLTTNMTHFRTPSRKVSFFSPLHVVDSELQRVPVKTDACIVAVVADTHGFCNFLLRQTAIEDRKSSSSQNVPIHSASGGYCFSLAMSPATVTSSRHAGRDGRTRSAMSFQHQSFRYGFQQGL
jgi:hypothetical protein